MPRRVSVPYVALLAGCLVLALVAGWTTLGVQIDNDAYDFLFRLHPPKPWPLTSCVLGIDEQTLTAMGGLRRIRSILAEALELAAGSETKAVVVDLILTDPGDAEEDARLEAAMRQTSNLVLASDILPRGGWEDPLPGFAAAAEAVGHVHADHDPYDNIVRQIPLEKVSGRQRRWALSLEAFRQTLDDPGVIESPEGLQLGERFIPAPRDERRPRPLLVRYLPRDAATSQSIPEVSVHDLKANPALKRELAGKVVFIGITAQSAAQDRHMTPYSFGQTMPGVEIHATAYETLANGVFLQPASEASVVLFCLALSVAAGVAFARLWGWPAWIAGGVIVALAHLGPWAAFLQNIVVPYAAPLSAAWLSVAGAASYQYFAVRRQLRRAETERQGYQQAIHFVAHEMRSPLTAIQGSSELMSRYPLSDEKREQIARTINSESKRLGKLIQTFLDVERISAGQMELKREPYDPAEVAGACIERARPLAERKRIKLAAGVLDSVPLRGDRELLEYAVYNLLTNAIKYSPPETTVEITTRLENRTLRLAVKDQGYGMDEKELRSIFQKFYRTKKAEASGEPGTGIGLSIVQQIVSHHGGKMEVASSPGRGSCFTIVLPASAAVPNSPAKQSL
jgi:signal transduction histidine kinase